MKVCIIGAGVAGLSAAKHCIEYGYECTIYEQTQYVGGTWNYTDEIGIDSNGIPIHTVMYHDLTTNLPKELMEYHDYPYTKDIKYSYLKQPEVLNYIHRYVEKFQLNRFIKFYNQVVEVKPISDDRWYVRIKNLRDRNELIIEYDAIMICNGHYSVPFVPKVKGIENFRGKILHSSHFRRKYAYVGKRVLIIGSGSSGTSISGILLDVANKVVLSTSDEKISYPLDDRLVIKCGIKEFNQNGSIVYNDDSLEDFDAIIFCTGYRFSFPFLSVECSIQSDDNYIRYLYKHIININYPTMGFIGVPYLTFIFPMMDIQNKFFLECLKRQSLLPTKELMLDDIKRDAQLRREKNWPIKHNHRLGLEFMYDYFGSLAKIADIKPLPDVLFKIYKTCRERKRVKDIYKIIDDNNFVILNE